MTNSRKAHPFILAGAVGLALVPSLKAATITAWTFENDTIAVSNTPAPSAGVGAASAIGMTNSFNGTTSTNTDDVLQGASGDTGANTVADLTKVWRVRGQSPGNGWSSQAGIGTQGAQFMASTAGFDSINISFDWYATTQGEANLQLQYTTDGTTWINQAITLSGSDAGLATATNSSSANTVVGSYVTDNHANITVAGQDWFTGLTASITDPNAADDPNFGIRLVNASTGADDISTQGTALNNTSGNWRFDSISVSGTAVPEPSTGIAVLGGMGLLIGLGKFRRGVRKA